MILELIRWPIGQLILLLDHVTAPKPPQRAPLVQNRIDEALRGHALYQFHACPFCVKTRRAMRRLGVAIETRDARRDPRWRSQLLSQGGRLQVPCLYIPGDATAAQWQYESNDIIAYLEARCAEIEGAPPA
ncbi:MAG: glutaredoxin [Chromatiaceae bacterium]|jgi:glutaredoxin|nr:glutaredoxin [Chromatiaceae bacterium]